MTVTPSQPPRRTSAEQLSSRSSSSDARSTSVLDLDELLQKIPQLIARLTEFQAFAVYLLDPQARRAVDRLLGRLSRRTSRGRCA